MAKKKGKPTRTLSAENQAIITRRVKSLLEESSCESANQLIIKAGLDNTIIYKLFSGKRSWNLDQIEAIANALGVGLADLVQEPPQIKVVGGIIEGHGPLQQDILNPMATMTRPFQMPVSPAILAQMYCLEVLDRSLTPAIPPGAFLFAQRGISETINIMDYVLYWSADGQTSPGQIIPGSETVILKSLTQGVPDQILPRRQLVLCDKIIRIDFP